MGRSGSVATSSPADAPPAGEPMLVFVHIPRTGGGTVTSAIQNGYARPKSVGNMQRSPEGARNGLRAMGQNPQRWRAAADHFPYGLCLPYLPPDTRYLTILRDPVDRVISHYHFHARRPRKVVNTWSRLLALDREEREKNGQPVSAVHRETWDDRQPTLEEGLAGRIPIYDNLATRFLWGGESIFGELPADALERAKANLERFAFVGLTEHLDESVVLLGRTLGVGLMPYERRHVNAERPAEDSAELRRLVEEHNALDVELYRFACTIYAAAAEAAGDLSRDVEELRRLSESVTASAEPRGQKKRAGGATKAARSGVRRRAAAREAVAPAGAIEERLTAIEDRLAAIESRLARG